ncbi:hypothetical protein AVEN_102461-1 [Araneus ventricosus]|uniref:Uncharacterized protein n=1 Tax=Araneus ventricosus TaxID=182803 RepID=A0A4Y2L1A6_ARAVE|nr:hypothetical protein AVEN_102461-1 [Araneus ventricosus]
MDNQKNNQQLTPPQRRSFEPQYSNLLAIQELDWALSGRRGAGGLQCSKPDSMKIGLVLGMHVKSDWGDFSASKVCPYSPDFNPCDYFLWGTLKDAVFRNAPASLDELEELTSDGYVPFTVGPPRKGV